MTKSKRRTKRSPHETEDGQVFRAMGYVSPKEAAKLGRVAQSTVYGWVSRGLLADVRKRKGSFTSNGVLWLLRESVLALRPPPATLTQR